MTDNEANTQAKNGYQSQEKREKSVKNKLPKPLVATSPTQRQGSYFEQLACTYLQQQGLQLIAQNWHQPKVGELDLVMIETGSAWSTLVFIEVRQRLRSNFGDALLSVTARKQAKVIKTAQYFLQQHPEYADFECRFDVVAFDIDKAINTNTDNDKTPCYAPEWLAGVFVAKAW